MHRYAYVHTYVPVAVMLRNVDKLSLRVSFQPIELYLQRGLDGVRFATLKLRSVDERRTSRACGA